MINKNKTGDTLRLLREKAASLPLAPGVYIMMDRAGKVIYVGKSRLLRNRVSSYFKGSHDIKTQKMASSVYDFRFIDCDTEMEALVLENDLIKQYKPHYNILLKDAKSYPYIKVTIKDEYPRIVCTRKRLNDSNLYFGPYSGTSVVYDTTSTLERIFQIPNCSKKFPRDIGKDRPCVYYQMKRCCGLCTGMVTEKEYRNMISGAIAVLKGDSKEALSALEKRMYAAAESEHFEEAARCRDSIDSLKKMGEKRKTDLPPQSEFDLIALSSDETGNASSVFYIRDGIISDSEHFLFGPEEITTGSESPIISFIVNLYEAREHIPKEILISFDMDIKDTDIIQQFLEKRSGHRVIIRRPERGDLKKLCDMAVNDASIHSKTRHVQHDENEKILVSFSSLLGLEVVPERIESYDISNYGTDNITAGMIVITNGSFDKKAYRTFTIKNKDVPDDYASMKEAIRRRLSDLNGKDESFSKVPDLILLDGGKTHVGVIRSLIEELGLEIPVFGMVKDEYHKTRTIVTENEEVSIARDPLVFRFVYGIQEEVHRFTYTRMSQAKSKSLKRSSLEDIPGIGNKKASKLIKCFGTLSNLKEADKDQIASVNGINVKDAENIYFHFHASKKEITGEE